MPEEQTTDSRERQPDSAGHGLSDLAMNTVAASPTQEPSEIARHTGATWLIIIGVVLAAAVLFWVGRSLVNLPPGKEAELRLRVRLQNLPAWQTGALQGARYLAGDALRLDFSSELSTDRPQDRDQLRQTTVAAMKILMEERPNRDLRIEGHQGDKQVVRGEYRRTGALITPGGKGEPNIMVRVEGDPAGLTGAMSESGGRSLDER